MTANPEIALGLLRVILYFDINGTIYAQDKAKAASAESMLIHALAENSVDVWDDTYGPLSFKQYVHDVLLPGEKSDQELKKRRQAYLGRFISWMQERNHPALVRVQTAYDRIKEKFTDQKTQELNFTVFPSFYVMIERLREKNIPFTIVLRTYGQDLPDVIREIQEHASGILFTSQGSIVKNELHLENEVALKKAETIFDRFLLSNEEHFALRDDWKSWNEDGERARSGKPFFYDTAGVRHNIRNLSLFFDDNITGEEKDIVCPVEINGAVSNKKDLEPLLFRVNTIEAILDDNYFINRVLQSIERSER